MTERIRLVGIARGPTEVLVQRTVVADDQGAFGRIDLLEPFEIEQPDGRRIRVVPAKDARVEPLREEKVKWGDIEDDPSFASLREKGPGPHVTVVVKRAAIREGEPVAIDGEEKEFAFDEKGASMRGAAKRELAAVSAEVLAGGTDAEEILARVLGGDRQPRDAKPGAKARRKSKKEREQERRRLLSQITLPRILVAIAFLVAGLAATMRVSPAFVDFVALAITLYALALAIATWRSLPRFVHGNDVVEPTSGGIVGAAVMGVLGVATMLCLSFVNDLRYAWSPPVPGLVEPNASWLVGPTAVLYLLFLAVLFVRASRRRASLLAAILDAPPFTAPPDETRWGSVEGVVRDPTPVTVAGAAHALANVVAREVRPGSDPDIVVETVLNQGTFFVDSDVGTFEIDPSAATWASAVRTVTTDTEQKHTFADVVVIGGRLVVAGRAVTPAKGEPARFVAGRAESLVFYAAGRDAGARARARMLLWRRRAAILGLAAAAFATAGVLAYYEPQLPAFHVEGGGD